MRAIFIALIAILLIGMAHAAFAHERPVADPYVVKKGDSIWRIVKQHADQGTFAIRRMAFYVANPRLISDSRVFPKDVVYLPKNAARYLVQTQSLLYASTPYTVKTGDSISGIAAKQMEGGTLEQRMTALYMANPVLIERSVTQNHLIRPGEVYRLPTDPIAYLVRVSKITHGRDTMWGTVSETHSSVSSGAEVSGAQLVAHSNLDVIFGLFIGMSLGFGAGMVTVQWLRRKKNQPEPSVT